MQSHAPLRKSICTALYHTIFCAPQISRDDPWFPISASQTESICGLQLLVLQYNITAHYTGLTFLPFTLLLKSCSRIRAKTFLCLHCVPQLPAAGPIGPRVALCRVRRLWHIGAREESEELGWVRRAGTAVFSSEHLEQEERQNNWELLYRQTEQTLKA